jgi:hypothetical protein
MPRITIDGRSSVAVDDADITTVAPSGNFTFTQNAGSTATFNAGSTEGDEVVFSTPQDSATSRGFAFTAPGGFATNGAKLFSINIGGGADEFKVTRTSGLNAVEMPGMIFINNLIYIPAGIVESGKVQLDAAAAAQVYTTALSGTLFLESGQTDGASAIAFKMNSSNAYSTSGAKLLTVENGEAEKFALDKDGLVSIQGTQVLGTQQAHVADPAGGATVDTEARTAISAINAVLEAHGLMATS